jgi:hypothetical protein
MFTRGDCFKSHRDQRVYHVQVDSDWGLSYNRDSLMCSNS